MKIPNRIDLKLILKATLKNGSETYIGPPCFRYHRWPSQYDQSCYGKYSVIEWKNFENDSLYRTHFNVHEEDDDFLYMAATKRLDFENNIIKASKKELIYYEICFDIVNFVDIRMNEIDWIETYDSRQLNFDLLTFEQIEKINQESLDFISSPLQNLEKIYKKMIESKDENQQPSQDAWNQWLEYKSNMNNNVIRKPSISLKKVADLDKTVKHIKETIKPINLTELNYGGLNQVPVAKKPVQEITKKSQGFGDTVKKITDKMGIQQCGGCKKRQEWLNKYFPYKKK